MSKHSRKSPPLANNVEGATGHVDISKMWYDHFKGLLNCIDNITHRKYVLDSIGNMPMQYDLFTPAEIKSAIEGLKGNKASGTDSVFAEHLKYAGAKIHVLLSLCFNACMVHGFLPSTMTDTILVPIIKYKTGNASSKTNYRPIALTSVLSKVFETALLSKLESVFETSDYQFGFKSHHSTDLCIYTVKEIVEYYKSHSTSVYICFMDASKAFDRVNHWTLFLKMIDSGMPPIFVRLIVTWYCEQHACVRWGSTLSPKFNVSNGVRQGGILSPLFFNLYMDRLSVTLSKTKVGCALGKIMVNHLAYADDLVILSPSAKGLQKLLNICSEYGEEPDIMFNHKKTEYMYFPVKGRPLINVPKVFLNLHLLQWVTKYKYLGTILTDDLSDDSNMLRQRGTCYARCNGLIRNFSSCSFNVKVKLF